MWRSVAARASLSRHAARSFRTTQNPKVPSCETRTLIPHFSTWVSPETSLYQNPRFFSQYSTNPSSEITDAPCTDSNGEFDENPDLLTLESEQSPVMFDEDSGSVSQEPDSFFENGDTQIDLYSVESSSIDEEAYEIDLEKLESVLSLLQSSLDGSLESSLDSLDLALHEEFVVRVIETPLVPGENLIRFFKWAWTKQGGLVTTHVVDTLVRAISGGLRKKEAYFLWNLVKEIGEKENGVLNGEILNELIALFSNLGKGKAGFEVYNKFAEFGCVPNEDTYYFTIEALCRCSIFDWAASVSEKMLNAGSLPDSEKIGKIISWLCKGSKAKDAHLVYLLRSKAKEVYEIDLEKLEGVLSLLQSSVDGSLESSLDSLDLALHEEFVVRVLETPLVPGENLIRFFKWASTKQGGLVTTHVVDTLVRAISGGLRKKEAYFLWDLVKEIGEKENGVLNGEILNELIALFSKLGKGKAGFEVFNKFAEFGCVPNEDTYYFTIEALCRRSIFDWAASVSEKMLNAGSLPDSEKIGKIISWLCKGSKAKDAHLVYLLAKQESKFPPRSSVNFLISSLCRDDETVQLALEMLEDFSAEVRKHAINPFSAVIRGLCRIKNVEEAKKLLFKMIDAGPLPGNAVFNSLINTLSKAGDMEEAKEMMKLMESRGLKPDVYTYSVIMSGYVKGGQMKDACKVLSEAKKKHTKLTPVTYHILIRGYCKLEEFDKALKLLSEMKDFGVRPNTDEYNKLIQSLCLKALDWGTAEKLLEEMKENGLHLNGITRGLIRAVKEMEEEGVETREVSADT